VPPNTGRPAPLNAFAHPLSIAMDSCNPRPAPRPAADCRFGSLFDRDDFFRSQVKSANDLTLNAGATRPQIHAGYQQYVDFGKHDPQFQRMGLDFAPGGTASSNGTPVFFRAYFQQQGSGGYADHSLGISLKRHSS